MMKAQILAALALAAAIGGAAIASDGSELGNPGMLLYPDASMVKVKVDSKMHKILMEHAKMSGKMIYASAGHTYEIENVRMADGRMLYDVLSPGNPEYVPDFNK